MIVDYLIEHSTDQIFLTYWELAIPYVGIVFFPDKRLTRNLTFLWAFACGIIYLALILYRQPNLFYFVFHHYATAEGFKELAADPYLNFAIYMQIICWDLLTTYWVSLDAKKIGISNSIRVPFLLVFMNLPPASLAVYIIVRLIKTRELPSIPPDYDLRKA